MLGKILTNLAETLCWVAPQKALEIVEDAIELNTLVQAPIEIGKAVTAKSLALIFSGKYEEAIGFAHQSKEIQEKSGYINGTLYAMQAEGIARHFLKQIDSVTSICEQMNKTSQQLGVYSFLRLPLLLTLDPTTALKLYRKFEWLDVDEVICQHKSIMKL